MSYQTSFLPASDLQPPLISINFSLYPHPGPCATVEEGGRWIQVQMRAWTHRFLTVSSESSAIAHRPVGVCGGESEIQSNPSYPIPLGGWLRLWVIRGYGLWGVNFGVNLGFVAAEKYGLWVKRGSTVAGVIRIGTGAESGVGVWGGGWGRG